MAFVGSRWWLGATVAVLTSLGAQGQEQPQSCPGLVASTRPLVQAAAFRPAAGTDEVALTFVGHATFLLASPGGVTIATDYNDYVRPAAPTEVATMNRAHSTHHSNFPDPRIRHVLRGWNPSGGPARHDLQVGDVRVRNVSTNIRDWSGGTEYDGNSIFVFETAELCIAHLGHLHHTLAPEHLKKLGRIDVLLVPVDGGYTLDTDGMMDVLRAINAPLMLPMHYFNATTLDRFLAKAKEHFPVEFSDTASLTLSRAKLPKASKILVLPGR
jgi:L-ascorbate metabolism protein UlaG (beta-lactamase superfamily)